MHDAHRNPEGSASDPSGGIDDLARDLQSEIDAAARERYGPEAFKRWRNLPPMRRIEDAHGVGKVTGDCGDTIEISIMLHGETITSGAFFSDGCGSSQVCASVAVELAVGKSVDEAYDITGEDILAVLKVFPEDEKHCAHLAAKALNMALHDFISRSRA